MFILYIFIIISIPRILLYKITSRCENQYRNLLERIESRFQLWLRRRNLVMMSLPEYTSEVEYMKWSGCHYVMCSGGGGGLTCIEIRKLIASYL